MASKVGCLIQDQNLNFHSNGASSVVGKGVASKPQEREVLGGRKPRCDVCNTGKAITQPSKKQPVSKIIPDLSMTKGFSNSQKALSDVSNTVKSPLQKKHSNKSSVVVEEEGFLHNHQDCIKAMKMDQMDHLTMINRLDNDSSLKPETSWAPPQLSKIDRARESLDVFGFEREV